jgi:ribosomal protein S18 acetylase RimI-like enzyme
MGTNLGSAAYQKAKKGELSMSEVTKRDARPADGDAIMSVTAAAYRQYERLMPHHWEFYWDNIQATLRNVVPAAQIVAEISGQIVGTVLYYSAGVVVHAPDGCAITKRWPEVRLLAVNPEARGNGVGKALMLECIRRARESGAEWLTLHSNEAMDAAMRLYARLGFEPFPEINFHPVPEVTVRGFRLDVRSACG